MEKGNVLVIGNSGVGKSTLINAVLGEEKAKVGWGTDGTTDNLNIYENEALPFRIIDTVGFEPSFIKKYKAINAVKKWSKNSAKEGHEDTQINVIWYCVDGTSRKLFPEVIKDLSKAIAMWKSVPVIVVITKSYSIPDRKENIEMVEQAFANQKNYAERLHKIIPVVASTYVLNDNAYAAPDGITELIDATIELMPEGMEAAKADIAEFKLKRRRAMAHSVTGVATTAGIVVGAVPISFSDALLLGPIEIAEVNGIAKIYGIKNNEETKLFLNSIVEAGTVGSVAKAAISALKSIPGINLGASVLNAVIAASIVAAVGEGAIYAFEQVYLGKKSIKDVDWVTKVMESRLSNQFLDKVTTVISKITENTDKKTIANIIMEMFKGLSQETDCENE
mgnify:CR=1 FL=1